MTRPNSTRDQLAETLTAHEQMRGSLKDGLAVRCSCGWIQRGVYTDESTAAHRRHVADALLPVVERIANEWAAEALELAAVLTVPSQDTAEDVREALFRRAEELRAATSTEETAEPSTPTAAEAALLRAHAADNRGEVTQARAEVHEALRFGATWEQVAEQFGTYTGMVRERFGLGR